ncbi:MAG: 1-deoxy-D-xylulose-5-phosphate synthase [Brevinemataceae bacterium]
MKYNLLNIIQTPQDVKAMSLEQLLELSKEIRHFLIENVTKTGGHLAPNLGVVELTIALHYVFDSPKDSFIWDVGHQAYVHKLLTGRMDLFPSLRKKNGLSGYPCPYESSHDIVHAGHSSTSVSIGTGIATAKKAVQDDSATVAVIGDGAFTSGMVYEALNDIAWRNVPLVIVLNDNKMSISENVGGISKHLNTLRSHQTYLTAKKEIHLLLSKSSIGKFFSKFLVSSKSYIKKMFFPHYYQYQNIFENLGIPYIGPFEGHDLKQLITLFTQIKKQSHPVIIHIMTEKGYGHPASQDNPVNFHGISGTDDSIPLVKTNGKSWSKAFGNAVCRLAQDNQDVFVLTAAMREGTGLAQFAEKFPQRFIDVGIAEQHAVSCAVGLAIQGKKPIVAIYSTFLQRAYDQILHDAAIGSYSIIFCLDRSGFVPNDGKTHQGVFDISYLRSIPGLVLMSPINEKELNLMLDFCLTLSVPTAIRYPKDFCPDLDLPISPIVIGEGVELCSGTDGVIVIIGSLVEYAFSAVELLAQHGRSYGVYHLRFCKPIADSVLEYLQGKKQIIILEEGIQNGGIGQFLRSTLLERNSDLDIILKNCGDQFPDLDSRNGLLEEFGFDPESIVKTIIERKIPNE